jgi:hypothetical protein
VAGALLAACAGVAAAAAPSRAAMEYVPDKIDEASCEQGATTGKDAGGAISSAWYFIGTKPPCTSAGTLKKFCARLQTLKGYSQEAAYTSLMDNTAMVNAQAAAFDDDADARAAFLYSHQKQGLQKSLQKCALNDGQLRAKFVAEARARNAGPGGNSDYAVIVTYSADRAAAVQEALTLWKRECAGHPMVGARDNELNKYWIANPRYKSFCEATSQDEFGMQPKDLDKLWNNPGAFMESE